MRWHSRKTDDEHNPEAAIARQSCKSTIIKILAFQFMSLAAEEILEGKPRANLIRVSKQSLRMGTWKAYFRQRMCLQRQSRNRSRGRKLHRIAVR